MTDQLSLKQIYSTHKKELIKFGDKLCAGKGTVTGTSLFIFALLSIADKDAFPCTISYFKSRMKQIFLDEVKYNNMYSASNTYKEWLQELRNPKEMVSFDDWLETGEPLHAQHTKDLDQKYARKTLAPLWLHIIFYADPDYFVLWRRMALMWKYVLHMTNEDVCQRLHIGKSTLTRLINRFKDVGQRSEVQEKIREVIENYVRATEYNRLADIDEKYDENEPKKIVESQKTMNQTEISNRCIYRRGSVAEWNKAFFYL